MTGVEDTPDPLKVVEVTPWEQVEEMLRTIPLYRSEGSDAPLVYPYANATISLERFRLSELGSTTRYIQEDLLARQIAIRERLLLQGYDQLDLWAGRLIFANGVRLAPPVVERYEPEGMHKYIIDGAHRAHLARQLGTQAGIEDPELTVIYVRDGITHPPYALVNPWDEVQVVDERPQDKSAWKNYRDFPSRYDLYRDYGEVFDSTPRGLDEAG